jgi:CheY-like chemotaxis protein
MVPAGLDPELLAAFAPEFAAIAARLATASDAAAAAHAIEMGRGMAEGFGIGSLAAMLAEAAALLDPPDLAGLRAAGAALGTQAAAIAAAGRDLPPPAASAAQVPAAAPASLACPPGMAAAPPPPTSAGAGIRVLLVDDSATMRRIIRDILAADPDFTLVGEAGDGAEALDRLRELAPDLTLLDIEMPVLDGIGVLRAWALRGPGAVVVVSSAARPGSAVAREARRLGAAAIIGKPSGALSLDLRERSGLDLRAAARHAAGLPPEPPRSPPA